MRAIGLDMSITCAGVAVVRVTDCGLSWTVNRVRSAPGKVCDAMRYHLLCEEISDIICLRPTDMVFIEEYAYGANGQITRIAELGGILRYKLLVEQGFDAARWFEVGQSSLKKFVTGKGNIHKEQVMKEVYKRFGFDAQDNNEADACGLAMLGGTMINLENKPDIPKHQREAINAVLKRNEVSYERFRGLIPKESYESEPAIVNPGGPRRRPRPATPAQDAPGEPTAARNGSGNPPTNSVPVAGLFARRKPAGA